MKKDIKQDKRKNYQVRLFRDEDKQSLLQLSKSHYKEREQSKEEYFEWLHQGGPAGKSIIVVGEEISTGKIIGFAFYVPFTIKYGKNYKICHLGCNALVQPDYRRKGVYAAFQELFEQCVEDPFITYGFPKPQAVVPHSKVGKFPISTIPLMVRPLNIDRLTKTRYGNPVLRTLINTGWNIAGSTLWRPSPVDYANGIQVIQVDSFGNRFDKFWSKIAGKYEIIIKRDSEFLNWRFCNLGFRSYDILSAQVGDELVGYAVIRCTEIQRTPIGLVMDMLIERSSRGEQAGLSILSEATKIFTRAGMDLMGSLMFPSTNEFDILRKAGFVNAPARFSPQVFQLMVTSLSLQAPREYLEKKERWFMTMANHDAV
jgi:GNAT superfamily N-acetyltransferase